MTTRAAQKAALRAKLVAAGIPDTTTTAPSWISIAEVARTLGVSRPTVYRSIRAGDIGGAHIVGGRYVVSRRAFLAWWDAGARTEPAVTTFQVPALRVV